MIRELAKRTAKPVSDRSHARGPPVPPLHAAAVTNSTLKTLVVLVSVPKSFDVCSCIMPGGSIEPAGTHTPLHLTCH